MSGLLTPWLLSSDVAALLLKPPSLNWAVDPLLRVRAVDILLQAACTTQSSWPLEGVRLMPLASRQQSFAQPPGQTQLGCTGTAAALLHGSWGATRQAACRTKACLWGPRRARQPECSTMWPLSRVDALFVRKRTDWPVPPAGLLPYTHHTTLSSAAMQPGFCKRTWLPTAQAEDTWNAQTDLTGLLLLLGIV